MNSFDNNTIYPKMLNIKFIGLAIVSIWLLECGGWSNEQPDGTGDGYTSPIEKIVQLENKGLLPKLDRSNDLLGPDTNANGIRDDVEAWIDERIPHGEQRDAAYQFARALQKTLALDLEDKRGAMELRPILGAAAVCVADKFHGSSIPNSIPLKIEPITMNTKTRFKHYWAINKHYDGTVWAMPDGNTCDKY